MSPSDEGSGRPSDQVDLSTLFMRRYKHSGRVILRPIWFYISLNKNGYAATKRLIINHGGKISSELGDAKTSKTFCLIDPFSRAARDGRPVYSIEYIQSCISAQRLLNIEDFRITAVGRPRRTPSKQHRPSSGPDRPPENTRGQTKNRTDPETETRDSEVTEDLPCIGDPENDQQCHEPPTANGQMNTIVAPEVSQRGAIDSTEQEALNDNVQGEGQKLTQARPASSPAAAIAPKKRKSSDWVMETTEDDRGSNVQKEAPQTVTPIKDDMNWSKQEDDTITHLCREAKQLYHDTHRDPNRVYTLMCWLGLEKQKFLPHGRSANQCLARAKHLWKNGSTETPEPAEEIQTQGGNAKRARFAPRQTGTPYGEDEIREDREQPESHPKPQSVPERHEVVREGPEILKNASRHETREYIFELVSRIAKHGRVTKRRAFRALRQERGHWKRALQLVTGRKGTSDA